MGASAGCGGGENIGDIRVWVRNGPRCSSGTPSCQVRNTDRTASTASRIRGATARGIAFQLHEAMGILPRASIEDLIGGLDDAGRAALRQKKVRLGPILVFIPALNKPAGIRLRALLWSLWHGRELPAQLPPDGMTSISVEGKTIDPDYYRAVGYPGVHHGPNSRRCQSRAFACYHTLQVRPLYPAGY